MKKYDIVFHLSHNDLDGYASQYAMTFTKENILFYNTSYEDVNLNINLIFKEILNNKDKKILFLITDVSFDINAVNKINNFKKGNKNIDVSFQLLDHHKSNSASSEYNDWYYFDNDKCATLLTCEYVIENFKLTKNEIDYLKYLGDFVDSHDRWLETHKYHHKANFLSDFIFNISYPDFLNDNKREYIFFLIKKISLLFKENFISKLLNKNSIEYCEKNIMNIIKSYLQGKIPDMILKDKNLKLNNKMIYLFTTLYEKTESNTYSVEINGKIQKFKILFDINSTIFQYLSHYYLGRNSDVNFMISVKKSGSMSFRSRYEECDVSYLAKTYFNGGGHSCASGGNFKSYGEVNSIQEFEKLMKTKMDFINFI